MQEGVKFNDDLSNFKVIKLDRTAGLVGETEQAHCQIPTSWPPCPKCKKKKPPKSFAGNKLCKPCRTM